MVTRTSAIPVQFDISEDENICLARVEEIEDKMSKSRKQTRVCTGCFSLKLEILDYFCFVVFRNTLEPR